jgi:hypothetical protein
MKIKGKNKVNKLNNNKKNLENQLKKNLQLLQPKLAQHTKETRQEKK